VTQKMFRINRVEIRLRGSRAGAPVPIARQIGEQIGRRGATSLPAPLVAGLADRLAAPVAAANTRRK
jgi:hypothetical protein